MTTNPSPALPSAADGGPAFPVELLTGKADGMSLRDYFAIHADVSGYEFHTAENAARTLGIDGAPTNPADTEAMFSFGVKVQAAVRYRLADAMLSERAKAERP